MCRLIGYCGLGENSHNRQGQPLLGRRARKDLVGRERYLFWNPVTSRWGGLSDLRSGGL